jgi:hypothetical protein
MKSTVCVSVAALLVGSLVVCVQADDAPDEQLAKPSPLKFAPSGARLANADDVRKRLGLLPEYENVPGIEAIKIAVLDYGFDGLGGARQYLPANAVIVEHYDAEFVRRHKLGDPEFRKAFAPQNSHGRSLAQIVWAVTGLHPNGPQFFLLNANGPTMLRRAVRYAIDAKVDVILFSGTFEGGGNGDGRGPMNRIVADALAADILWINAAGNYGGRVYNGPVKIRADSFLRLGAEPDSTALRFRNLLDENTVAVTLTWNDYREQEDAGTDKDLDLIIEDGQGKRVGASEKTQVQPKDKVGPEETLNPRERVVLVDLPASGDQDYRIRMRAKKGNFGDLDQIRVVLSPKREVYFDPQTNGSTSSVRFVDASGKSELLPPADNPLVITVGELNFTCSRGPTLDHRVKPDVILPDSRALFTNGEMTFGTSNSAAYFAGVVAVLKAADPGLRTRHLLWFAHYGPAQRVIIGRDGMPLSPSRPAGADLVRSPALRYPTLVQRLPTTASRLPALASASRLPMPLEAGQRLLRLWQTPSRQELGAQVQKKP